MNTPLSSRHHLPFRDLRRLAEILRILVKHGWRHYIERIHLHHHVPAASPDQVAEERTAVRRLRIALEELGPTFVKFGQMLSVRPDLFPADVIIELGKLQDHVPPFPVEQARKIIEAEIGRPIDEIYAQFEDTPLAAASITQVHSALLPDGTKVVVTTASGQTHDHHQRGKLWREREAIYWVARTGNENISTCHKPDRT